MDHITSKGEPQYQQSYCAAALQYKETQGEKKKPKQTTKPILHWQTIFALLKCSTQAILVQ